MDVPRFETEEESIGGLLSRLMDDGRVLAKAEMEIYRQIAIHRLKRASIGAGMATGGFLVLSAAITALLVGIVIWLSALVGPVAASLIVGILGVALGGILMRSGLRRVGNALRDTDQKGKPL